MDASLLHIEPAAAQPIYRQITEQVRRLVAGGQLAPGDTLPSVRDVAAAHAINPMTVSKAYSQLEAEGVLERQRGKGMAVAPGAAAGPATGRRWQLIEPALDAVARQAQELELPPDEVLARLRSRMEEHA
ncbi:GntR family transcriptional regulator [Novilysobacter spongiicola]|uniref:GntR family transcriptional regulator n=1 Tax=Lysobacter spongiicola DSM 21749 TaxID=1122188 RepID=A0A1T4PY39_9GAMM|nr:GntR family transcriptional regulator [Lysobacter spongiicola]SJZ96435.1 GntR family transcriptional regulator [Lysobacter spongiicola DSM 21749]